MVLGAFLDLSQQGCVKATACGAGGCGEIMLVLETPACKAATEPSLQAPTLQQKGSLPHTPSHLRQAQLGDSSFGGAKGTTDV